MVNSMAIRLNSCEGIRQRLAAAKDGLQEGDARQLAEQSLRRKPDFAAAHEQLADLLISERHYAEGYQAWQRAIVIFKKRNLTNRERYYVSQINSSQFYPGPPFNATVTVGYRFR